MSKTLTQEQKEIVEFYGVDGHSTAGEQAEAIISIAFLVALNSAVKTPITQ